LPNAAFERACLSLEGLSVGDGFGERFFSYPSDLARQRDEDYFAVYQEIVERRAEPPPPWPYTDDTEMALSIVAILRNHSAIDQGALARAAALDPATPAPVAAAKLGNGTAISAQDTAPFAIWCAGCFVEDYPAALWNTASGYGDVDTTCAIVGGIVALRVGWDGIPAAWRALREPLPNWPFLG
jgi:ADP-ribosylglycohydrolase